MIAPIPPIPPLLVSPKNVNTHFLPRVSVQVGAANCAHPNRGRYPLPIFPGRYTLHPHHSITYWPFSIFLALSFHLYPIWPYSLSLHKSIFQTKVEHLVPPQRDIEAKDLSSHIQSVAGFRGNRVKLDPTEKIPWVANKSDTLDTSQAISSQRGLCLMSWETTQNRITPMS